MIHENFDVHHPDDEKSQILSIIADYAPNLITTLWGRVAFPVGQLEFKNLCLFFCAVSKKAALYQKCSKSFANPNYCVYFLTMTALNKIWLSGKFYPVLCTEQQILKISFTSREILKLTLLWRQQLYPGYMVELAMEYYHGHPTMVAYHWTVNVFKWWISWAINLETVLF